MDRVELVSKLQDFRSLGWTVPDDATLAAMSTERLRAGIKALFAAQERRQTEAWLASVGERMVKLMYCVTPQE